MGKTPYFCDLSVSDDQSKKALTDTFNVLVKLGYRTVAIEHFIDESTFQPDIAKKKKEQPTEAPILIPPPKQIDDLVELFRGKLNIVHRLTVSLEDKIQAYKLGKSENIKKYNLLAVLPKTDVAFQFACSSMEVDIITFDPTNFSNTIKVGRKMYHMAAERGIYFEVMYAPAIKDSFARRNIIHMSHLYHTYGKSKNIILTSGAKNCTQIRGPYDIINLGLIFGLNEEQSKGALTRTCRSLLISAEGRRHGKATFVVSLLREPSVLKEESDEDSTTTKRPRMVDHQK